MGSTFITHLLCSRRHTDDDGHDTLPVLRLPHHEGRRRRQGPLPLPLQRRSQEAPGALRGQREGRPYRQRGPDRLVPAEVEPLRAAGGHRRPVPAGRFDELEAEQ